MLPLALITTDQILTAGRWSGYATLFCAALTILAWGLKWGLRFRLVGATGFMGVLTGGLFALSLGFYNRPEIAGALRFARVYDTGGGRVVITVPPPVTADQVTATLQQAAIDLYSPGRSPEADGKMTIRLRTIIHPQPGISQPLYVGQARRTLVSPIDDQMDLEVYPDQLAQIPQSAA
jgi:hypothetical protein